MQEISNSLNAEAVRLLAAIIRYSSHKPRGRRWNFEGKILALSLLKCSPKILYSFSDALASGRTLQSLLNTVHFRTGINTHVLESLCRCLQNMSEKDRLLLSRVQWNVDQRKVRFNQKFDCIEGFEDLGSWGRMCNVADHGLHQKWKQPVAYFLSYESTTTEMLVQFLNEVLGACQNMGLHVVATVCDMSTDSVKAMNCWVQP